MKDLLKYKKIIVVIVLVVVGFVVYSYLFKNDKQDQLILNSAGVVNANQTYAGREIVVLLSDLRSIKLNDDIFSNPAFKKLIDFSLPISSEPKGRNNPFAPIGVDTAVESENGISSSN
jgi:hypothetical protein